MEHLADRQLHQLVETGGCELIADFAAPFTLRVVADLEGVPESDHQLFADRQTKLADDLEHKPLEFLYEQFTTYIEDRRRSPRDDIMTAMATATFPDGTTPEVHDVARSEEHTSELQSLMRNSYAVFCLQKKTH